MTEATDPLALEVVGAPPSTDGRVARRDRNKLAVLDAAIELFTEGNLEPGPDEVAARAGLSPRSVYRYFDDSDALLRAAIDRHLERVMPVTRIHAIGEGTLAERIERFAAARVRLYEAIASSARASRRRAVTNTIIAEQVQLTVRGLSEQIDLQFAPELRRLPARRRRMLSAAADALCQLETLDYYTLQLGLSASAIRSVLVDALHRLFDPTLAIDPDPSGSSTRS